MVLDGDASNPGGLARLMFGSKTGPKPLIDFFGGREKVECPVDNPASLTIYRSEEGRNPDGICLFRTLTDIIH